jgi:hypothetical protein
VSIINWEHVNALAVSGKFTLARKHFCVVESIVFNRTAKHLPCLSEVSSAIIMIGLFFNLSFTKSFSDFPHKAKTSSSERQQMEVHLNPVHIYQRNPGRLDDPFFEVGYWL